MLGLQWAFSLATLGLFSGSYVSVAQAQSIAWQTAPFNPPTFPLVVKSPYTSAWATGAGSALAGQWPYFGASGILGWTCYVRVDNTTYTVQGAPGTPNNATNQTQTEVSEYRASTWFRVKADWNVKPSLHRLAPLSVHVLGRSI